MNRLLLLLTAVLLPSIASGQQAFLTFLHNSAAPSLATVDVYVTQSGYTTKVEDLQFQKGDNFNTAIVFGGFECFVDVAPSTSASKDEAIAALAFTPEADAGYEIELRGVPGDGFAPNPGGADIKLAINQTKVPFVDPVVGEVSVMFSHGATDLEACDVYVRGTSKAVASNLSFGQFTTETKQLKRQRQTIDLTAVGDKSKVLASFEVDFSLISSDVVILTISGFKTPADNHESSNALALLAVLEDGNVINNPLLSGSQKARVQFIHNSPDAKLATVDIYINGVKAIDNISFKRATGFGDYEAGTALQIAIAPASSTGIKDTIASMNLEQFRPGRSYHLILQGVQDTAKYKGHGSAGNIYMTVLEKDAALEKGTKTGETSVRSVHGVIDLSAVDLVVGGTTLGSNMTFNSVAPEYINVTGNQTDTIWAVHAGTNTRIRGWIADLRGSERAVVAALAGVVGPDSNQQAEAYELILIDANGSVNDRLVAVDSNNTPNSVRELVPSATWLLAPNPATLQARLTIPMTNSVLASIGQGAKATLVNITGESLLEFPLMISATELTGTLFAETVPAGQYRIIVRGNNGAYVGSTSLQVLR